MRLIDADKLKKAIEEELENSNLSDSEDGICYCKIFDYCIDNAPTIVECGEFEGMPMISGDLTPRPQGQWKVRTADDGLIYYQCTVCWKNNFFEDFPFCPYCGASMKTGRLRKGNDNGKKL